jgi:hypothetical protein
MLVPFVFDIMIGNKILVRVIFSLSLVLIALAAKKNEFFFSDEALDVRNLLQSFEDHNSPRPPVILLPGLVGSRMLAWKRKPCRGADIEIQDILWLNLQKLFETLTYDKTCWLDCLKLAANSTDPPDCKIRPDEGLAAIGDLSPGNILSSSTTVFTPLIKAIAHELHYDSNNIIGFPYDWRLSPVELEKRDSFFTKLRLNIETTVKRHQRPAIIITHSMGTNLFLYFCDWLKLELSASEGTVEDWMDQHVYALVGYGAPLLGAPTALKSVMSGHNFGLPISELQTRELMLTYSSTHFLSPRSSTIEKKKKSQKPKKSQKKEHLETENPQKETESNVTRSNNGQKKKGKSTDSKRKRRTFPLNYNNNLVTVKSFSPSTSPSASPTSSPSLKVDKTEAKLEDKDNKDKASNNSVSFTLDHVANGSFFHVMGDLFNDSRLYDKYRTLHDLYTADPLKPLSRPYERPPVRHVIMIYGVDLPTEIGYVYRMPDEKSSIIERDSEAATETSIAKPAGNKSEGNQKSQSSDPPVPGGAIIPILEEVYIEETIIKHRIQTEEGNSESLLSSFPFPSTEALSHLPSISTALPSLSSLPLINTLTSSGEEEEEESSYSDDIDKENLCFEKENMTCPAEEHGNQTDGQGNKEKKPVEEKKKGRKPVRAAINDVFHSFVSNPLNVEKISNMLKNMKDTFVSAMKEEYEDDNDNNDDASYEEANKNHSCESEDEEKCTRAGNKTKNSRKYRYLPFEPETKGSSSPSPSDSDSSETSSSDSSSSSSVPLSSTEPDSETTGKTTSSEATGPASLNAAFSSSTPASSSSSTSVKPDIINHEEYLDLTHVQNQHVLQSKSGVFMVKPKTSIFSSNAKTFIEEIREYDHAGDATVPYVSLSYCKKWLRTYDDDDNNENDYDKDSNNSDDNTDADDNERKDGSDEFSQEEQKKETESVIDEDNEVLTKLKKEKIYSLYIPSSNTIHSSFNYTAALFAAATNGDENGGDNNNSSNGHSNGNGNGNGNNTTYSNPLLHLYEWSLQHNQSIFPPVELFYSETKGNQPEDNNSNQGNEKELSPNDSNENEAQNEETMESSEDTRNVTKIDKKKNKVKTKKNKRDQSTLIIEVSGADHLEISKLSYIHYLLFQYLLPKMTKELCLSSADHAAKECKYYGL